MNQVRKIERTLTYKDLHKMMGLGKDEKVTGWDWHYTGMMCREKILVVTTEVKE